MFRTAEMRPVSGASFTPGPWCSHGCHLDFSHHCRLPAAGPFPRYCFHLPEFWLTELAEIHSRSPFPVFPLPVTSGWNAGPWAFSRASHPAVTSDACQERERALSTRPELTADQSTLHSSYLTQTVRPHVAPRYASNRDVDSSTSRWMPSQRRWSISAITPAKVAPTRHTFCRRRSGRDPGNPGAHHPGPLGHVDRRRVLHHLHAAPRPPPRRHRRAQPPRRRYPALLSAFFLAATPPRFPFVNRQERGCPGSGAGKAESDRRARKRQYPARKIAPSTRLTCGHEGIKVETASRADTPHHPAARPRPPPAHRKPAPRPRLDNPPGTRHPGTGHGAGRRTGSTPVAATPARDHPQPSRGT